MNTLWARSKLKLQYTSGVYYFAAIASFILSFWMACREYVINPDAICYVQSAAVIGDGGLRKAMNLCSQAQWPLYSVLIYFFSVITHLQLTYSAYFLDAVFSAVSVVLFMRIIQELGGKGRVLWLAAAIILLSHQFNSVRQYIIRDHGFWAFYLASIFLLLRFFTTQRWYYALGWSMSLLFATLFRIEGIVFLIFLPWIIWFYSELSKWQRIKGFIQLNFIAFSIGLLVFGWLIFHPEISLASLGRMQDFVFQLFHAGGMVWWRFQTSVQGVAQTVLTPDSKGEATLVFMLALMAWYGLKVIANLSIGYSVLTAYGMIKKVLPFKGAARPVLWGYLLTNLVITCLFLAEHLFLSKRYLIAFSLVLMLWVPFALEAILVSWKTKKISSWAVSLMLATIIVSAIGGIFDFGYSKAYMRDAGNWLSENVPVNAELYSNDYQVMYYSKHFGNDIFSKVKEYQEGDIINKGKWRDFDYLAIRLSKKEVARINTQIKDQPVQVFANKRGDQVRIYKVEE